MILYSLGELLMQLKRPNERLSFCYTGWPIKYCGQRIEWIQLSVELISKEFRVGYCCKCKTKYRQRV